MNSLRGMLSAAIAVLLCCQVAQAEIFVYRGANGERLVSDHPMPGYDLVSRRDTVENVGHILANRPVAAVNPEEFQDYINTAGMRYGLDPALLEAIIQVESGFNPHAVSRTGATGLMQLMKETAAQYDLANRFDPAANIDAGARHLKYLMERFDGELPLVLAAYNAGATTVERYQGLPPFPETRQYVTKVLGFHLRYRQVRYGAR